MTSVKIMYQDKVKQVRVKAGQTVADASRLAGINPQTVLFRVKNTIVPDSQHAKEGMVIEAIRVISGG